MTPAQKVAVDAMREAWAPEVVERMLRVERLSDPGERDVFDEECFEHWLSHGHGSIGNAALTVLGMPCAHDGVRDDGMRCGKCGERVPFSPAETPVAASTHRPDSAHEINEALGLCPSCGQPVGNAKCWDCYGTAPALDPEHGPTPGTTPPR